MPPENLHATALIIGDRGLLITGPSGSGKTTLALALIDHFGGLMFTRLVGDDQLFVENRAGRLVCRAPATIAGLVEVPGFGPGAIAHEPVAVIDLAVQLVPAQNMPRMQEEAMRTIAGCDVPLIVLAQRNISAALPAVAAYLRLAPFR